MHEMGIAEGFFIVAEPPKAPAPGVSPAST